MNSSRQSGAAADEAQSARVRRGWLERFSRYPYTYLFVSMLALLILAPFTEEHPVVLPFFFLALVLGVIATLRVHRWVFRASAAFGLAAFLCLVSARAASLSPQDSEAVFIVGYAAYGLFLMAAVTMLTLKIFSATTVTGEIIKGAISVYFLMGILWAVFYEMVLIADPGAISMKSDVMPFSEIMYFSFVTLTTLGYGDITPASQLARNLAVLEATLGQIYMTVLIARLVGLHTSGRQS
jgi:voltage-gated potassium channel